MVPLLFVVGGQVRHQSEDLIQNLIQLIESTNGIRISFDEASEALENVCLLVDFLERVIDETKIMSGGVS